MNHSYATYPGVQNVLGASYTLTHGITPSVVSFQIAPQTQDIAAIGPVVFYHGALTLTLLDCKADQASMVRGTDGTLVAFTAADRRWRWKFGEIYGTYNQLDSDGKVIPDSEKTPQQLAQLLLDAMGESADVSQIPNNARPPVDWVGANPAEELADLLESFGMVVVLGITGAVSLLPQGVGAALPVNEYLIEQEISSNPPEMPAQIRVLGAPVRYQARLLLEPVGYEISGALKHIDDLSYKPAGGWEKQSMFFPGVVGDEERKLAVRDIFRLYRIADTQGKTPRTVVATPDGVSVEKLRQILPLERGLVLTGIDQNGVRRRKPEAVYGIYYLGNTSQEFPRNSTQSDNYQYKGRFDVDYDRGLVRFDDQITAYNADTKLFQAPAVLYLECSFLVRHRTEGSAFRYFWQIPTLAPSGYGVDVVRHEELVWEKYEAYPPPGNAAVWVDKIARSELDPVADYYARGRLASYVSANGASGKYVGLQAINPDGAIQQVTWEIGGGGCYTSASRLYEPNPYVPPYKERRVMDMQRAQRRAVRNQGKPRP